MWFSELNERKITHQRGNTGPALRVAAKNPLSALFVAYLESPNDAPHALIANFWLQQSALKWCKQALAHKINEAVTHSLCISREAADTDFLILTPCGICQEWLTFWGGDVLAAISTPNNELVFKPLRELQPHHWSMVNGDIL